MLKFLRQYNKYILVVGGVLLMIAFLIPGAIREFGHDPAKVVVMRLAGHKVTQGRMHTATLEYEALERLTGRALPMFGVNEGAEQWFLLAEMAERGGYVGGAQEGRDYLPTIARQMLRLRYRAQYGEFADQLLNSPQFASMIQGDLDQTVSMMTASMSNFNGLTEEQVAEAVAKLRGINRLQNAYALSARVSAPRSLVEAKKELDKATIDHIFLGPDRVLADVPEPDESALQAQLDRFKESKPGEGELGIGYLLPARVKLEYLTVNRKAIEAKINPDPKDVRKRFQSTPQPKDAKFDDVREQIENELRNEAVERVLHEIDAALRNEVNVRTRRLATDGQFRVVPADWSTSRPTMETLRDVVVQKAQQKTGVAIDAPAVEIKAASFLTGEDLQALPGIGSAFLERGARREPFAQYALSVRELMPTTPFALQVGLPSPEPVKDREGSVYYFTVLDARKESAPLSVDDAREMLVRDWKRLQAYEALKRDLEGFKQKAVAEGLDALDPTFQPPAAGAPPTKSPLVKRGTTLTRGGTTPRAEELDTQALRDRVMEAAERLDPTKPADDFPVQDRTLVIEAPRKQGLVALRINAFAPLTLEQYRLQQNRLAMQMQYDEARGLEQNPFSLARLRERLKATDPEGRKLADRSRRRDD